VWFSSLSDVQEEPKGILAFTIASVEQTYVFNRKAHQENYYQISSNYKEKTEFNKLNLLKQENVQNNTI
jgi:hypothetical protein